MTPAAEGPNKTGSTRCSFNLQPGGFLESLQSTNESAEAGRDGNIYVQTLRNGQGLASIVALVRAKDLRFDYDFPDYFVVAQRD